MSDEIDQLRADIATLEAANKVMMKNRVPSLTLIESIRFQKAKLVGLEAEAADRWAKTKIAVNHCVENGLNGSVSHDIALYARHLEHRVEKLGEDLLDEVAANGRKDARIAELEKELESRPRVWCVRNDRGEIMKQSAYDRMAQTMYHFDGLFPSRELASRLFTGETEPYRGEEQ